MGPLQHAWLEVRVAAGVLHQVVAAHETLVAQRALKLLLSRVGAVVASQLIGAGKLLTAVRPGTWERPLSCNRQSNRYLLSFLVFQPADATVLALKLGWSMQSSYTSMCKHALLI